MAFHTASYGVVGSTVIKDDDIKQFKTSKIEIIPSKYN
jgi:hypothetical protein